MPNTTSAAPDDRSPTSSTAFSVSQPRPNIAALLTAPPPASGSAIAVVRLRGPLVEPFLQSHFSKSAAPGRCVHGTLSDGPDLLDDPVVVLGETGDFADINLHGSGWIIDSVMRLAARFGFSIQSVAAEPEFESPGECRSLLEREMLAALPLAQTKLAIQTLLNQPALWRRTISQGLDRETIGAILGRKPLHWLLHPPRVAIVGEPNVGKSSLANQLFAQERSITANVPGTTRDWVGEIADIDGLAVMLLDTPGIRATSDPIEAAAIDASRTQIRASDLVLRVVDATEAISPAPSAANELLIVNKIDLARDRQVMSPALAVSARTGVGVPELRHRMGDHFGVHPSITGEIHWWTQRQRSILQRALSNPAVLADLDAKDPAA